MSDLAACEGEDVPEPLRFHECGSLVKCFSGNTTITGWGNDPHRTVAERLLKDGYDPDSPVEILRSGGFVRKTTLAELTYEETQ